MTVKRFLMLTIPAAFFSFLYSYPWYIGNDIDSRMAIYPTYKPLVYRALMPMIARIFPIRADVLVVTLIALSGAAFIVALWYLVNEYYPLDNYPQPELVVIALFAPFVMLFGKYPKLYDLPTATLWTLCLLFLQRGQYRAYLAAFALACVNRETAILFVPVTLVYLWSRNVKISLMVSSLSFLIWSLIQAGIHYAYQDAPGSFAWIVPLDNLRQHAAHPVEVGISVFVIGIILYFIFRDWKSKPNLLRLSFAMLAPVFIVMYLVMGQAFEYRVFAEIYPVMAILAFKGIS